MRYLSLNSGTTMNWVDVEAKAGDRECLAWLYDRLWTKKRASLPPKWSGYEARVVDYDGGLVVTIFLALSAGDPVVTVGVASRANHGNPLWRVLTALPGAGRITGVPKTPWCGVLDHRESAAADALQDFISLCAWSWVDRPKRKFMRDLAPQQGG